MNILETDRLILCRLTVDDAAFILDLLNGSLFLRFIGDKGVRTRSDARKYIFKWTGGQLWTAWIRAIFDKVERWRGAL